MQTAPGSAANWFAVVSPVPAMVDGRWSMVDACGGHRSEPEQETKPPTPGRLPRRCWAMQADYEHQLFNFRLTATSGRLREAAWRAVADLGMVARPRALGASVPAVGGFPGIKPPPHFNKFCSGCCSFLSFLPPQLRTRRKVRRTLCEIWPHSSRARKPAPSAARKARAAIRRLELVTSAIRIDDGGGLLRYPRNRGRNGRWCKAI
jgi:hypothetical protein